MPFRADASQAILRDFRVGISQSHRGLGDQPLARTHPSIAGRFQAQTPTVTRTIKRVGALHPTAKNHLRKTPTGFPAAPRRAASMLCRVFQQERFPLPVGWRADYHCGYVRHTSNCSKSSTEPKLLETSLQPSAAPHLRTIWTMPKHYRDV